MDFDYLDSIFSSINDQFGIDFNSSDFQSFQPFFNFDETSQKSFESVKTTVNHDIESDNTTSIATDNNTSNNLNLNFQKVIDVQQNSTSDTMKSLQQQPNNSENQTIVASQFNYNNSHSLIYPNFSFDQTSNIIYPNRNNFQNLQINKNVTNHHQLNINANISRKQLIKSISKSIRRKRTIYGTGIEAMNMKNVEGSNIPISEQKCMSWIKILNNGKIPNKDTIIANLDGFWDKYPEAKFNISKRNCKRSKKVLFHTISKYEYIFKPYLEKNWTKFD